MKYEFDQNDVFSLAAFADAEIREDGDELQFRLCPYCHGGDNKDKYSFSVNRKTGLFNCFRASCGKQGHFVTLARDLGFALDFGIEQKEYRKLPQREIKMRPKAAEILKRRGINLATVERFHITVQTDNPHILVFPFYDETGQLVSVKYRNSEFKKGVDKSKEWFEKDTKPILFGMDQAKDYSKPLVITEGQIDALSLAECGIANTVSVPNGCTSFTWVPNCFDWVNRFPSIIVMGDSEHGKITLVDEISKRFQKPVYCVPQESYYGLKDANDILQQYGADTLRDSFNAAAEYMPPHIRRLADVQDVDFSTMPRIKTGIQELDSVFGGMFFGQVILLTGRRGEGKSTFMGQLILEAIDQGNRVLAYSGELTASHFKNWIDFQAAGKTGISNFGTAEHPVYKIMPEIHKRISDWYRPYAYIYDNESVYGDEFESLLDTIEGAIIRYGINFVCIDNLMTAMDINAAEDLYRAQSVFVRKLKNLAVRYNIVVLLVAHPRKESTGILDNDSVAGSSDITNRVDSVLIYSRKESGDGLSHSTLKLTKNRINGKLITDNAIELIYSESSKRITPENQTEPKHYGWERNLFEEIKQNSEELPF